MRIVLVGPSYPFRGGIPHNTTLLFHQLKKKHKTKFISFTRQYPNFLFPGKTDKDTSQIPIKAEEALPVLDSLNPFTWLKTFLLAKREKPDLIIFPWWVSYWMPPFWLITTLLKKFTKSKILFICHNVVAHESRKLDKILTKIVLKKGDFFIVHSEKELNDLKEIVPNACVKKVFLPTYKIFAFQNLEKKTARQKLNLPQDVPILLFFGIVRPYKGLKTLLKSLPLINEQLPVKLLVAGEFWEKEEKYRNIIKSLNIETQVKIINKYIPNEEVNFYFSACDVVVLPYATVTGSGPLQIAFGMNKPVIATNVGSLPEVIKNNVTGFIVPLQNARALAEAIVKFFKEDKLEQFSRNVEKEKGKYSWEKLVEVIEKQMDNQTTELKFTGEYFVHGKTPRRIAEEHLARYEFACQFVQNKIILDAACGTGYGAYMLAKSGAKKVIGLDINERLINYARSKYSHPALTFKQSNLLSFHSESHYDVIVSFETIEHLPNPQHLLRIFYNTLNDDGLLIISTPNRAIMSPGRKAEDKPRNLHHLQEFTLPEFDTLLKNTGFKILEQYGQRLRYHLKIKIASIVYHKIANRIFSAKCQKLADKIPKYIVILADKS